MGEMMTSVVNRVASTGNPYATVAVGLIALIGLGVYEITQKDNFNFSCSWGDEKKEK